MAPSINAISSIFLPLLLLPADGPFLREWAARWPIVFHPPFLLTSRSFVTPASTHYLGHPLPHHMALANLKPSPMLVVDREVENEKVASTRCAAWDLLCQADWVITIQEFWGRYGDRKPLDWPRMLTVYQDQRHVSRWRSSLNAGTKKFFGDGITAETVIGTMKEQLARPNYRTIRMIVNAMRSLDHFSKRVYHF